MRGLLSKSLDRDKRVLEDMTDEIIAKVRTSTLVVQERL